LVLRGHSEPVIAVAISLFLVHLLSEPPVGKTKPVMGAPALAELHEIFLGQGGGALELFAGKHCQIIQRKENAPELDYSSFYGKTGMEDQLLCSFFNSHAA
jgi:hypothetical protein